MPDIDIDFVDRDAALKLFKHIPASRIDNDRLIKHNTGVYLHSVPMSAVEAVCSVPYDHADAEAYFKIDFLNVGIYKGIRDEIHLIQLMETEPLWDLLQDEEFIQNLFHVNGHGSILRQSKPESIEQLAAVLAMIRPAKRYLIGKDWTTVMAEVWRSEEHTSELQSHACISYAVSLDRKSTRLNSSHMPVSRMPSSA